VSPEFSVIHSVTTAAIPPHAHSEHVISYYFAGCSECRIGSKATLEYRQGDIGLFNPGDAHEDFTTGQARDYVVVSLKKEFFQALVGHSGPNHLPHFRFPKLTTDPGMSRLFEGLRTEVDGQNFGREILLRSLVTELSVHFLRQFTPLALNFREYEGNQGVARWQVRKALEYLQSNFNQEFSLDHIATVAGLSKYYLERVFKKATGLSPHSYMLMLRVQAAQRLLASSARPIVDIAMDLGFSDQSHFTNVFKKLTGITPHNYRLGSK